MTTTLNTRTPTASPPAKTTAPSTDPIIMNLLLDVSVYAETSESPDDCCGVFSAVSIEVFRVSVIVEAWSPSACLAVVCSSVDDIEYPVEYVTLFVSSDILANIGDDVAVVNSIVDGARVE